MGFPAQVLLQKLSECAQKSIGGIPATPIILRQCRQLNAVDT